MWTPTSSAEPVAVIFQDFERYLLPARENVGLGRKERIDDVDAILEAARARGRRTSSSRRSPKGYETMLGREFSGGFDLSIGQWQRVALARAFFRDAPFVILDEPTAALDARAESRLFERMRELLARPLGRADLASVLERALGGPHLRAARGARRRGGLARGADGARRPLRGALHAAGACLCRPADGGRWR